MIRMFRIAVQSVAMVSALTATGAGAASSGGSASGGTSGGIPSTPPGQAGGVIYPFDMHNYDRAMAFGALQLNVPGTNLDDWKEVNAYDTCDFPTLVVGGGVAKQAGGAPDPLPPAPAPTPTPDSLKCWSVMVTTAYQLVECPDGEAFIARSGVGVDLQDRHTGSLYAWEEIWGCDDGTSTSPSAPIGAHTDAKRPLEFQLMQKKAL